MYDVIIIGAGPAGIMASIMASSKDNKVLLIEKNDRIGKKLELTGGMRCNVTNLKSVNDFIEEIPVNKKMLYSILNQFGPQDIYDYFTQIGVPLKVEDENRVFPKDNKSKSIINALNHQLNLSKTEVHLNEAVLKIEILNDYKNLITDKETYKTKNIIISTGGCSYPQTGSTGDGYKFATSLNQRVNKLYPAETFLIYEDVLPLPGLTMDNVKINFNNKQSSGSLLFTHIGLSGPAVFKISEEVYKYLLTNEKATLYIDMVVDYTESELLSKLNLYDQKREVSIFIKEFFPKRLVDYITLNKYENVKIGDMNKTSKEELISTIKNFKVNIKKTGTLEQSFVTGGGVDVKDINPKTMESKKNKGIYFVGEVVDVHGHTGGYNITIALSTGYASGIACSKSFVI